MARTQVFISYSHLDKKWLKELQISLKPHVREGELDVWDDTEIAKGAKWRDEIRKALGRAKAAVLLVSRHFLASDFIANDELPPLLAAAEKEGLVILWVAVSASAYLRSKISDYQCVNDPLKPLDKLSGARRNEKLVRIAEEIYVRAGVRVAPPPPKVAAGSGLAQLKHIVVLMMGGRSFDHMLGYLKAQDPRIDGITGSETNPDTTGALVPVSPQALYESALVPAPGRHFADVMTQIFGDPPGPPTMQGFVQAYFKRRPDVGHSHKIMDCFPPAKLPVITTLARKYATFNRWFCSVPGPSVPNRAFAHFGTSFGKLDNAPTYSGVKYPSIYERMAANGRTAKIYYYDEQSGTLAGFVLRKRPELFNTFSDFRTDCGFANLPDYSFVEPNYTDHDTGGGTVLASDQHPDHNVLAGEVFIAEVYQSIVSN